MSYEYTTKPVIGRTRRGHSHLFSGMANLASELQVTHEEGKLICPIIRVVTLAHLRFSLFLLLSCGLSTIVKLNHSRAYPQGHGKSLRQMQQSKSRSPKRRFMSVTKQNPANASGHKSG